MWREDFDVMKNVCNGFGSVVYKDFDKIFCTLN